MTESNVSRLKFLENHQTSLNAGDYEISIRQTLEIDGELQPPGDGLQAFEMKRTVGVYAERFALKPKDVFLMFPPAGSLGEHSNVQPHLMLTRSTLPWERRADPGREDIPWLGLLVFHGEEAPEPRILTLGDLAPGSTSSPVWPPLTLEKLWQKGTDPVTVIDVEKGLLERILPGIEDLEYLAHVRQGLDADDQLAGDELAVIVANRLPRAGGQTTIHLVSLEGRFTGGKTDMSKEPGARYWGGEFNYQGLTDGGKVRLISLRHWSFSCVSERYSFIGLLKSLSLSPDGAPPLGGDPPPRVAGLRLLAPDGSRMDEAQKAAVERCVAGGHVLLPRHLLYGGRTAAWYHGPLIPKCNERDPGDAALLVDSADDLYAYDPVHGLLDVSYAAAWQLGRLLVLRDKAFALKLYNWKRGHAQKLKRDGEDALFASLFPDSGAANGTDPTKTEIDAWLRRLALLDDLPFNYLVPDERMLPPESIRFFWLDWFWVECLLDGAYSIGRVLPADKAADGKVKADRLPSARHRGITGFLLRSQVVAGWPGLEVAGFPRVEDEADVEPEDPLPMLRIERLSESVLLCLFDGELQSVDFYLKPEALQFGLKRPEEDGTPTFHKELRDPVTGDEVKLDLDDEDSNLVCTVEWRGPAGERVLDVAKFAEKMAKTLAERAQLPFTSADLALQMIEGSERVRIHM